MAAWCTKSTCCLMAGMTRKFRRHFLSLLRFFHWLVVVCVFSVRSARRRRRRRSLTTSTLRSATLKTVGWLFSSSDVFSRIFIPRSVFQDHWGFLLFFLGSPSPLSLNSLPWFFQSSCLATRTTVCSCLRVRFVFQFLSVGDGDVFSLLFEGLFSMGFGQLTFYYKYLR